MQTLKMTPAAQQHTATTPILKVQGLTKHYGNKLNHVTALDHVSLDVYPGEFLGIMGPSGSGKTTLLNLLATIDRPSEGTIEIRDQQVHQMTKSQSADFRNQHLGFVFQDYNLIETLTVFENIVLPLTLAKKNIKDYQAWITKITTLLGISKLLDRFPDQLSGGEAQRVAATRAVVLKPDLVLADEPTGALDSASSRQLLELLQRLQKEEEATLLMVSHDAFATSYCSRILFLRDGKIYHELIRGQRSRDAFYLEIMDVLRTLGGGHHAD